MNDIKPVVVPLAGDQVISIDGRKRLGIIQQKYPKLEIIIGNVTDDDEPVSLDLAEMENSRSKIFDAATESILGNRVDRIEKHKGFPVTGILMIVSFLAGVGACFFVYNI